MNDRSTKLYSWRQFITMHNVGVRISLVWEGFRSKPVAGSRYGLTKLVDQHQVLEQLLFFIPIIMMMRIIIITIIFLLSI